jgi:RHS repeat-associated protein
MRTVQVGATVADTVTYSINALGQRVRKLGAGAQATAAAALSKTARFVYDEQGRLVGEYDNAGKLIQETVWMNDLPIATIRPKGASASTPLGITGTGAATANNLGTNTAANPVNVDFFYVHPDHLGTPRVVTKPADNKRMWEWQSQPFGETAANENPQNLTGAALTANQFRYNLRFPGQFYDAETSKHYNYFRDNDPSIGRYIESDPIGLRAGMSTYFYVGGEPMKYRDRLGLKRWGIPKSFLQGCGPNNELLELAVPDFPMGLNAKPCCDDHDKCYGECSAKSPSQSQCDGDFCKCLNEQCDMDPIMVGTPGLPASCRGIATLYCGVVSGGKKAAEQFNKSKDACKCKKT